MCLKPPAKYVAQKTNFICMTSKISNIFRDAGITVWNILQREVKEDLMVNFVIV